jgi:chemotaxis protein CheC
MNFSNLSDIQLDALREVSNVGAGHAATALSDLMGRPIHLVVPTIEVLDIAEMPTLFGGPEQPAGAAFARLEGQIDGGVLYMATPDRIEALMEMLGEPGVTPEDLGDERLANIMLEVPRRLIGSYLQAISEMTGLSCQPGTLDWAYDMAGALLQVAIAEIGSHADQALFVRTAFIDQDRRVEAAFFFVFGPESFMAILSSFGLA